MPRTAGQQYQITLVSADTLPAVHPVPLTCAFLLAPPCRGIYGCSTSSATLCSHTASTCARRAASSACPRPASVLKCQGWNQHRNGEGGSHTNLLRGQAASGVTNSCKWHAAQMVQFVRPCKWGVSVCDTRAQHVAPAGQRYMRLATRHMAVGVILQIGPMRSTLPSSG